MRAILIKGLLAGLGEGGADIGGLMASIRARFAEVAAEIEP